MEAPFYSRRTREGGDQLLIKHEEPLAEKTGNGQFEQLAKILTRFINLLIKADAEFFIHARHIRLIPDCRKPLQFKFSFTENNPRKMINNISCGEIVIPRNTMNTVNHIRSRIDTGQNHNSSTSGGLLHKWRSPPQAGIEEVLRRLNITTFEAREK